MMIEESIAKSRVLGRLQWPEMMLTNDVLQTNIHFTGRVFQGFLLKVVSTVTVMK